MADLPYEEVTQAVYIIDEVSGNPIAIDANNAISTALIGASGNKAEVSASGEVSVNISSTVGSNIKIEGSTSGNIAEVTPDNRLLVDVATTLPAGKTAITMSIQGDVSGNNADYQYFIIPAGETASLQSLFGSSEQNTRETYVAAWFDSLGNTPSGAQNDGHPNWTFIAGGYVNTAPMQISLDATQTYVGDGTARLVLHSRREDGGARRVFRTLQGYY